MDGHAEAGVEALADRDVRPEDPCLALVGSGVVLGVLGLGGKADAVRIVREASLLREVVIGLPGGRGCAPKTSGRPCAERGLPWPG